MKFIVSALVVFLFWGCYANTKGVLDNKANLQIGADKNANVETDQNHNFVADKNTDVVDQSNNLKVGVYENNRLEASYVFDSKEVLKQEIWYKAKGNPEETAKNYYYKSTGEFDRVEFVKNGKADIDEFYNKTIADFQFYREYLKSKQLIIPFADLIRDDVKSVAVMLSAGDNNHDFKKEIKTDGNKKVISSADLIKPSAFTRQTSVWLKMNLSKIINLS